MRELETLSKILEYLGVVAFAISGAMVGIEKKMDIFGVAIMGMITAVGGGLMRDTMLGIIPPSSLMNPTLSLLAIATSLLTFNSGIRKTLFKNQEEYEKGMLIFDSLGLGAFAVSGTMITITHVDNPSIFLLLFMGLLSGTGGSILRDILASKTPVIFVKHFYACAAIIGSIVFITLWYTTNSIIAVISGLSSTIILRLLAAHFKWNLPRAK